ncbi:MAG TPA: sigma factor-like helix-turn-helix DNA-binding protein [Candidatus Micrarchaeaceae archaeon]|nr:sigma factor-like helix-turn-helix DNA-binding protein [Candidatus Micrarchaeaceae archaeon]
MGVRAFKHQGTEAPEEELPVDHGRLDAMRSWLASGHHIFGVDPRRRLGRHGHAKQLLADDLRTHHGSAGEWQALASALDRHTIRGGMAELSPEERRVVTLAYLEGRTNREIAAILGVSVSTVRRRLWVALKRLDAYVSRTKNWLSAMVLLGAGYLVAQAHRLDRFAATDWPQKVASTVAISAVAAAAVALTAVVPDSAGPTRSPATALAPALAGAPSLGLPQPTALLSTPESVDTSSLQTADHPAGADPTVGVHPPASTAITPPPTGSHPNRGCHGNPTSAAPPVPVGRHAHGAPVSHPTAGGCRV